MYQLLAATWVDNCSLILFSYHCFIQQKQNSNLNFHTYECNIENLNKYERVL